MIVCHGVLIWKSAALGCSWPVPSTKVIGYVCELFQDALVSPCPLTRKHDLAVLVRQLPFVTDLEKRVMQAQKAFDGRVFHERMPDVVGLPPVVLTVERREEGCLVMVDGARRYIDELPILVPPDRMEFRFDVKAWHFMDGPANDALTADSSDDGVDDDEAFFLALASMGGEQDAFGGAVGLNGSAERQHVGQAGVGSSGGGHVGSVSVGMLKGV